VGVMSSSSFWSKIRYEIWWQISVPVIAALLFVGFQFFWPLVQVGFDFTKFASFVDEEIWLDYFGRHVGTTLIILLLGWVLVTLVVVQRDWRQKTIEAVADSVKDLKNEIIADQAAILDAIRRSVPASDVTYLSNRDEVLLEASELFNEIKNSTGGGEGNIIKATSTFYPVNLDVADKEEYFKKVAELISDERSPRFQLLIAAEPPERLFEEMSERIKYLNEASSKREKNGISERNSEQRRFGISLASIS